MLKGFKQFLLRGNVVDLAVGVVIGAAFGAVVTSFVKDILTPLISAVVGKPNFSYLVAEVNGAKITYGDFLNALISFLIVAAAVYFFVVLPINTPWCRGLRRNHHRTPLPKNAVGIGVPDLPSYARLSSSNLLAAEG